MKTLSFSMQLTGASAARKNSRLPSRFLLRRNPILSAWRAGRSLCLLAATMFFVFATGLRAQPINGQPQTPNAAMIGTTTANSWVPYTGDQPFFEHQWSPENIGSPAIDAAPADTRRGNPVLNLKDNNSDAIIAGGDMFVLAEDMSGDVKQPIAMNSCDPAGTGDASFVSRYQGVSLWRLNATTGAVIAGPFRLDGHIGICSLPHIVVTSTGNIIAAWKEFVEGTGYQVSAAYFTVATNVPSAPAVVTNTGYNYIAELALAPGVNDDAAFVFRNITIPSEIFVQRINNLLVPQWTAVPLEVDNPATPSNKWNPVIKWNAMLANFDVVWGDDIAAPTYPGIIMVQVYTLAGATLYGAGGHYLWGTDINADHCEFYMEPCKGFGGSPTAGITMFFYRDTIGKLQVAGAFLDGTGPMLYTISTLPMTAGRYPCSFTKRLTGGREDVIAIYDSTWAGGGNYIMAYYYNVATTAGTWAASSYGTNSQQYKSIAGINSNGMYVAVPDISGGAYGPGSADVYSLSMPPYFGFRWSSPLQQLTVRNAGAGEPYYSGVVTSGNLCLFYYQFGLFASGAPYTWSDDYTDLNNPETDETYRNDMEGAAYDFASFPTTYYWPFANYPTTKGVDDQTWDIDPNTAAVDNVSATVFSEINDSDGYSNIILGTMGTKWTITNANSTNGSYYQPKCGVYFDAGSGHYMALVTYIHEEYVGASAFEDVTVDLTTGAVAADPLGVIENATNEEFRNWAIVADKSTAPPNFVCVYGSDYTVARRNAYGQVHAVGYNGATRIWGWNQLDQPIPGNPTNSIDQVRACYNPDALNSGAYVIWRETPGNYPSGYQAGFGMYIVNSTTGPSIYVGLTAYGNPNSRGNPCVTAGVNTGLGAPYWALMAWEDAGNSNVGPQPLRIYANAFTNIGIDWPGLSNINGVQVSAGVWGSPDEAHHPDAIANPENTGWPMLAYDMDQTHHNGIKQIEIQNLDLSLIAASSHGIWDMASPDPTPALPASGGCNWTMDDAKWSLLGFMQRRPKLIAINAALSAYPYDRSGANPNLASWVMCVYETEAYNLYQTPATYAGGSGPFYGLAGRYYDMWYAEYNRPYNTNYLQTNIVARVINPELNLAALTHPNQPIIGGKLAVFANTNAQDLVGVAYTDSLGPMVTCLDYANTAQTNAIVRMDQVIPNYYAIPGIFGAPLNGTWAAPVPPAYTAAALPGPEFMNHSWFPLVLHPAVGSIDCFGLPTNALTWAVDASSTTITLNPEAPEIPFITIDYYGNWNNKIPSASIENTLRVTAHAECIPGTWPLSFPDDWGNMGNAIVNQGVGYKKAEQGASAPSVEFSVSLTDNPATSSETAIVSGIAGRTAELLVLDVLGKTIQKIDAVTISGSGTNIPLDVSTWPSGNYVIEAIGDEGSHARAMLAVSH